MGYVWAVSPKDNDHFFHLYLQVKGVHPGLGERQLRPIPQEYDMATLAAIDRENGPSFILRAVFGFDNFRPGQKEAIDSVLGEKDSIALLPTGAGKSIIYTVLGICLKEISIIIQRSQSINGRASVFIEAKRSNLLLYQWINKCTAKK